MHIDQLRTHTNDVQIMASGNWNGIVGDSHTHMVIDFGAENLGSLLNALGFGGLFEGGRTSAHLEATWPGEPSSLAMQRMTGTLKVEVSKGRIPEVQPGMGRLFGLMALTELPRRLSLDFGDVFGKGLGFDSIKGKFHLDDGMACTDDLKLEGVGGRNHHHRQDRPAREDLRPAILVVPHVGNSLPVVGAIAGGPVGAAAGLAIQGLLGHGLNKAASARYSLTGTWEKPKITLMEKTRRCPRPAASRRPRPGAVSTPRRPSRLRRATARRAQPPAGAGFRPPRRRRPAVSAPAGTLMRGREPYNGLSSGAAAPIMSLMHASGTAHDPAITAGPCRTPTADARAAWASATWSGCSRA